ncbi:hypothetical protein HAZT_HAZT006122 [Hyalella azteca]|nr:hypothetical protein HAZT_HAZT006122 [Hyalella azteca]
MVDHPRKKVHKHAHFEEKLDSGGFVHHRDYDLSGASVTLEPDYLPRRWLWSRKYPVCVRLRRTARLITSSIPADLLAPLPDDEENEKKSTISEEDESAGGIDATLGAAELDSFEHVTEDMCFEEQLYFFARSDRDKEIWFRRFVAAAQLKGESTWESDAVFRCYMDRLLHPWQPVTPEVSWINILAGRLLYDFLHNPYWANKIQERIQRKLSKVHLPPLVGELVVCGVTAGKAIPQLHSVDPPVQDNCGLWCDLSVQYDGNFTMTIETKIDLMKLKRGDSVQGGLGNSSGPVQEAGARVKRSSARFAPHGAQFRELHFDTDTDDSVESSSDDEDVTSSEVTSQSSEGVSPPGGGRRLMKLVDTLTGSRYFQQATDWGILRKAMKGVSNTRIVLSVRVEKLCGVLAVNIPPQPSDRIWYGFRTRPKLVMKAEPKLGDQPLSLPFLSNFIERQLRKVFEKIFVLPNMDDLVVPIMSPLLPGQASLPKPPWEIAESPTAPLLPSPGFEATTTPF